MGRVLAFSLILSQLPLFKHHNLLCVVFFFQVEKRRLFHIFLKQFLIVYRDWEPINPLQSPEDPAFVQPVDSQHFGDVVVGCSFGHPTEIIALLVEEVAQMIALVNERKLVLHPLAWLKRKLGW